MPFFKTVCQPGIVYRKHDAFDLTLDLYLPEERKSPEASGASPIPAVVYIHGGGWVRGSSGSPSSVAFALEIAAEGIAVACITYRLAPRYPAPAAIEDCKFAVRWLRDNASEYGIDPERIIAMGNSAGGHLAAMLAVTDSSHGFDGAGYEGVSSVVAGAVVLCGISDVAELIQGDDEREWASAWIPSDHPDRIELARRCSPIQYARGDAAPTLIVHGDADPYVPHHQAIRLHRALKKAGADVTFKSIPGAGHFLSITGSLEVQRQVREARRTFFAKLGLLTEAVSV